MKWTVTSEGGKARNENDNENISTEIESETYGIVNIKPNYESLYSWVQAEKIYLINIATGFKIYLTTYDLLANMCKVLTISALE